jgi:hypothetical protein
MAQNGIEDLTAAVKDAAFVTVGLGVIAFQRLQVRRNELNKVVSVLVGERLKAVEERVGAVLDHR